ncbi:MAG: BolA family protein [Gammaproteobacteria bacterium]|jgi:BolA protein|nr:BolA family protein [Gammaproteobacteria bacterium]
MSEAGPAAARIDRIRRAIELALSPDFLDITDESHLHAGHLGARSGKGHFRLRIIAPQFSGMTPIDRHRLVYAAVGDLMDRDIHALGIEASAPDERSD